MFVYLLFKWVLFRPLGSRQRSTSLFSTIFPFLILLFPIAHAFSPPPLTAIPVYLLFILHMFTTGIPFEKRLKMLQPSSKKSIQQKILRML